MLFVSLLAKWIGFTYDYKQCFSVMVHDSVPYQHLFTLQANFVKINTSPLRSLSVILLGYAGQRHCNTTGIFSTLNLDFEQVL